MTTTTLVDDQYAPVGRRVGGYFIDAALFVFVLGAFGLGPALLTQKAALFALGYLAGLVVWIVQWFLLGRRGYTVGKYLAGTRVLDEQTGQPLGMGRAFLRLIVLGLSAGSGFLLIALLIMVIRDPRRQGWHDKAARSIEVPVRRVGGPQTWTREPGSAILPGTGTTPPTLAGTTPTPTALTGTFAPPPPGMASTISDQTVIGGAPAPAPTVPPPPSVPRPPTTPAGGMVGPPPGLATPSRRPPVASTPPVAPVVAPAVAPTAPATFPAPGAPSSAPSLPSVAMPVVDEMTRISSAEAHPAPPAPDGPRRWVLRPSVGEPIPLSGATLLGRDPDAALHPGAIVQAVDDPAFTVSKTHALLTVDGEVLKVQDLDSTHGVVVRRLGDELQIAPRSETKLLAGDVVVLGAVEIAVDVD